jgi:two-component system nitrate/nitrite response regulator NarL
VLAHLARGVARVVPVGPSPASSKGGWWRRSTRDTAFARSYDRHGVPAHHGTTRDTARGLRVLVVDDDAIYRTGLRRMLAGRGIVLSDVASGAAALEAVRRDAPDVVLMDVRMPGISGIEATLLLRGAAPTVPVVMLTVSDDESDVVDAVRAAARGYVLKNAPIDEIVASIRAAAAGDAWISTHVTNALLAGVREAPPPPGTAASVAFTARERDVLRLIAAGKDNAAIGRELYISPGTVRKCVSGILAKLGVESRVEAAVYAVRHGLA